MTEQELLNGDLVDQRFLVDIPRRRKHPEWILRESIVLLGRWEPLFFRRRGGADSDAEDERIMRYEHGEEFVRYLKERGVNLFVASFSKNYQIDEEEFRLTVQLRDICWKHGIKLGVYIRGDQIYSEFFGDTIKKEDILAKRADGRVPTYGFLEGRKSVCFHKPKVMEMFKADIRRAAIDLKVDYLHFDGFEVGGIETIDACRCEACRRDFVAFLQRRYGDNIEACIRRFGHDHLEAIEPPGMISLPLAPTGLITEPVWQEWIMFRCTWSTRIARMVYEYVYSLRPEVAIGVNNGVPVRENGPLLIGTELVSYGDGADIMMNEDAYGPYVTGEGKIIQRARQHKMIHEAGCWAWNYMDQHSASSCIGLSHASAFNKGRVTYLGDAESSFLVWQKEHWEQFQDLEEVIDVAVWRERKAMAFADPMSYATAMQVSSC